MIREHLARQPCLPHLITRITPLRSNLGILRIRKIEHSKLAERFGNLLCNQVIAQLLLIVHYSEVIVVAGAEHAIRHHLVFALAAFDDPEGSPARLETVIDDVSSID